MNKDFLNQKFNVEKHIIGTESYEINQDIEKGFSEEDLLFKSQAGGYNFSFLSSLSEEFEKGKVLPIGTIQKRPNGEFIKTVNGWKYHSKGQSRSEKKEEENKQPSSEISYDESKHLSQIIDELTKDKRRRGWSTAEIQEVAQKLNINNVPAAGSFEDQVIKLSAIKKVNPNQDMSQNKYWDKKVVEKVFGKQPSLNKHISDMSNSEKLEWAKKLGIEKPESFSSRELDKQLVSKNIEKELEKFLYKK